MSNLVFHHKPSHPPLSECPTHGKSPYFIVCSCCLLFQQPVAHFQLPTLEGPGEILCVKLAKHLTHELRPICKECVKGMGLTGKGKVRLR